MGTKTHIRKAQPPTKHSKPTFLDACQNKIGKFFAKLCQSPSKPKPKSKPKHKSKPRPETNEYTFHPNGVRYQLPDRPSQPPPYDSLLHTNSSHLRPPIRVPPIRVSGSNARHGHRTSGVYVVASERDRTEKRHKTHKRESTEKKHKSHKRDSTEKRDKSRRRDGTEKRHKTHKREVTSDNHDTREKAAARREKRDSTGVGHRKREESRNESHRLHGDGPLLTKSEDKNEKYTIPPAGVLRGGDITHRRRRADDVEKADKRAITNNSKNIREIKISLKNSGPTAEKRHRTRSTDNKNERSSTIDNALVTMNGVDQPEEKETDNRRSQPEGVDNFKIVRTSRGGADNASERHDAFENALLTGNSGGETKKMSKRGGTKSKVDNSKNGEIDITSKSDVSVTFITRRSGNSARTKGYDALDNPLFTGSHGSETKKTREPVVKDKTRTRSKTDKPKPSERDNTSKSDLSITFTTRRSRNPARTTNERHNSPTTFPTDLSVELPAHLPTIPRFNPPTNGYESPDSNVAVVGDYQGDFESTVKITRRRRHEKDRKRSSRKRSSSDKEDRKVTQTSVRMRYHASGDVTTSSRFRVRSFEEGESLCVSPEGGRVVRVVKGERGG